MYFHLKKVFDFIMAVIAILLMSPLLLIISILIKIDSKGPIFFKQTRVGINKSYFNIYKFRTMRIDTPCDAPTHLLNTPEYWITRVGKVLRKSSLDELPQLINILKGDMSFVGPRPSLWNQEDLILERDKYGANNILPGLTGWAQVNGRDELPIEVKAKFDGKYVNKISLLFDVKILVLTFVSVLKRDGVRDGPK